MILFTVVCLMRVLCLVLFLLLLLFGSGFSMAAVVYMLCIFVIVGKGEKKTLLGKIWGKGFY